jgi:dTDP-4-amino-4,6-dideoxygalactose transaminase
MGMITMIPFNRPHLSGKEYVYIADAVSRQQISGDGHYTKLVGGFIERTFNTKKALLTTSCSTALDMAGILLNLKEDDEVVLPSYTFVSTANAVLLRGAKPVFADIQEDTLNIDPNDIEKKITDKTKAIFPVHYAGIGCDMDRINQLAKQHKLFIVEDAAQGVNAKYKDQYLGTIGDIGCYSFHETKNYSCGEGGAILINSSQEMIERAEIIREKGTNRTKFFRGEVDKYTWVDIGSSFLPSDMLAAFLYAQFENLNTINEKRKKVFDYYHEMLIPLEKKGLIRLPVIPKNCTTNYHMFYILLQSEQERDRLMAMLKANGVLAIFHYIPLHMSPVGRKFGYHPEDLPKTKDLSGRLLRLPMYVDLSVSDQELIVNLIYNYFGTAFKSKLHRAV